MVKETFEEYADVLAGTSNYDWHYNRMYAPAPQEPEDGIHPAELVGMKIDRSCDRELYYPCPHDVTWENTQGNTQCHRCGKILVQRHA